MNAQTKKKKPAPSLKSEARLSHPVSFMATDDEYERWKKRANDADRKLSWWIRNRLLELERIEEEHAVRAAERVEGVSAS